MARIDWVEHRLQNWARWKLSGGMGCLGYASVDLEQAGNGGDRDPYAAAAIPTNDIEASDTDDAVDRLPSELKVTVLEVYTGKGGLADKIRRLCCGESTVHARIGRAHRLLADHWTARKDRQDRERQRVEQLRDQARPRDEEFYQ